MNNNIQLIIPMSGLGKRFVNAGYDVPKPLIEVDGKPIIQHVLNLFPGVSKVTFICNKEHIANTNMKDVLLSICPNGTIVTVDYDNLGPVSAILRAEDYIDDTLETIVSYCDYGSVWDFEQFLNDARSTSADGSIACYKGFHPHMLGSDNYAFCREHNNRLIEIKEKKPFSDNKMNEFASNGTYYFRSGSLVKKYFRQLVEKNLHTNGEFYVSMVYNLLVQDKLQVNIFEIQKMLQWGTPYDLEIYKSWSSYFKNIQTYGYPTMHDEWSTLILPMSGRGSRFKTEGYETPKPFLDVDGKPMFLQAVNCLPKTKQNIFIALKEHIDLFDIHKCLNKEYTNYELVSLNDVTQGQACTCEIGVTESNIDSNAPIMISACDNGVYYDTSKYLSLLNDESVDVIVWSFRNSQTSKVNPHMYSWLDVDENNNIKYVSCKKFIFDDPLKTHAIIGTMFFRKAKYFMEGLYKNYESGYTTNNEYYVDDVINRCIEAGLTVKVFEVENYICWGTPNDYKTYLYWKEYFESTRRK